MERARPGQREAFGVLAPQFRARWERVKRFDEEKFLTDYWKLYFFHLEHDLPDSPPFSFLESHVIKTYMTARLAPDAVAEIAGRLAGAPAALLLDDPVGMPPDLLSDPLCSHNHLHHLNDLTHFLHVTGCDISGMKTVVEWGGGYGSMAKIIRRMVPGAGRRTYVLIDSSLMTCVQWLYLATIFGEDEVHQLQRSGDGIRPGKINLVPVSLFEEQRGLEADLFLSTFALSESSHHAQDRVIGRDWFNAKRLLLAYRPVNLSEAARLAIAGSGARIETTCAADGSTYAFR